MSKIVRFVTRPRDLLVCVVVGLALVLAAACGGGKASCSGGERCACYPNGTCNAGLSCLSNVCVSLNDAGADRPAGDTDAGAGGATGQGGAGGSGGATGTGGSGGATGTGGSGGGGGPDGGLCRIFETRAEASAPTVFVLVDRSGSMFTCLSTGGLGNCPNQADTAWAVLRTGVLQVVQDLQGVVRFGFGAFTGDGAVGGVCPMFDRVEAGINNSTTIASAFNGLGAAPFKSETPTSKVLASLRATLATDPSPGPKYILFVTDGEPDFCDDGDPVCPVDAVVHQLQLLRDAGVTTLVFGVQAPLASIPAGTLQAFANAGAGQAVAPSIAPTTNIFFQCAGVTGWRQEYDAAGRSGQVPIASYVGGSGNATVYMPDTANQQALTNLIASAVSGVKSCAFDLANGLRVDLSMLGRARVFIEGQDDPAGVGQRLEHDQPDAPHPLRQRLHAVASPRGPHHRLPVPLRRRRPGDVRSQSQTVVAHPGLRPGSG